MRRLDGWSAVTAAGYALVVLLFALPLASLFRHAFVDADGALSLARWGEVLGGAYYREALWHSLVVSIGGALGAVVLGAPLAYLTTRFRIPGRRAISLLALLSLLSPPFIGAYAWIVMLGRSGFVRTGVEAATGLDLPTIYGPGGIVLVFALQYYPFVYLLTGAGLRTVDRSVEEAAELLGATGLRKALRVTLPLVLPSLSAGALIAFILALANFGTPMILGGGYRVLPTVAYTLFTSEVGTDPGLAAAVCLLLAAISSAGVALQRWVAGRRKTASPLLRRPEVRVLAPTRQALAAAVCWGIVATSSLPLGVIVVSSFRNTSGPVWQPGFGLDSYRVVLYGVPRAVTNSLLYAGAAVLAITAAGALLGYVVSRRRTAAARALDPLLMLPYVVPGIVLGVGFITTFDAPPLLLLGTGAIIVLAYVVRRLPYAVRSSASILQQLDPTLEEAARSLGARPAEAFRRVTLPLMTPGLLAGAVLAWVTSINELSASIVLYVGRTITMPVRIYLSVLDGSFGPASALATILIALTAVSLYLLDAFAGEDVEGVAV